MSTAMKDLHGRIVERRGQIAKLFDKKDANGNYDWSPKDREDLKSFETELEDIVPKFNDLRELKRKEDKLRADIEEAKSIVNDLPFDVPGMGHPSDAEPKPGRRLSDLFLASHAYKSWPKESNQAIFCRGLKYNWDDAFKTVIAETGTGYAPPNNRTNVVILSAQRKPRVADLIPSDPTENQVIKYMLENTFTNSSASVAEGASIAQSLLGYTQISQTVEAVATYVAVTNQQLADVGTLRGLIDNRLTLMMSQTEENMIVNGNGTSPQLAGFLNLSSINTIAKGTLARPDAFLNAMTQIRFNTGSYAGFAEPDGIVMHPTDWMNMRLLKDAIGNYLWGSPSQQGVYTLWGLPVIDTPVIAQGTSLVGDFKGYSHISRRQEIDIETGLQNDDFVKNQMTLRAVSRLSLETYRQAAFCTVTGQ